MADEITLFSYGGLTSDLAGEVRAATERIKLRLRRTAEDIVAIGQDLIAVKQTLEHGQFGTWLQTEFDMSQDTAGRFMRVAEMVGDQIPQFAVFSPSALYALAAPSTPEPVREEVLQRVEAGESVSAKEIAEMKRRAQEAMIKADKIAQENQDLKEALAIVDEHKADLEGEIKRLKASSAKEVPPPETAEKLKRLEKQLSEVKDQRDRFSETLNALQEENDELKDRLGDLLDVEKPEASGPPRLTPEQQEQLRRELEEEHFIGDLKLKTMLATGSIAAIVDALKKAQGMSEKTRNAALPLLRNYRAMCEQVANLERSLSGQVDEPAKVLNFGRA